jgi:hypothetical protein
MREGQAVDAEFCGSLTITEEGELRPSRNRFGAVIDRFGVTRMPEDESQPKDRELRFPMGRER